MTPAKFQAVFSSMWETMKTECIFTQGFDKSRVLDVHPSQIPICPLSFILSNPTESKPEKYMGDAILRTGTTVHSVVQKFLGLNKYAFGDYVCKNCGEIFHLRGAGKCPNCKLDLTYTEVGIDYKGFVGHVDFMIKVDDEIWLVDFKTSGFKAIANKVKETPLEYDLQTLAYCLLLRLQYGLKIKGRAICYISRDNPNSMQLGGIDLIEKKHLKSISKILKGQRELLQFLLDCKSYKEFMSDIGIQRCSNKYCKYCGKTDYSDDELKKMLKSTFKERTMSIRELVNGG